MIATASGSHPVVGGAGRAISTVYAMTTDTAETFASVLRGYRLAASLSQETLAERANLSVDAIRALERGRRTTPRPDTVALLAGALGLLGADRARLIAAARPEGAVTSTAMEDTPAGSRSNLPAPLTALIGRGGEEASLVALLRPDVVAHGRLLTLLGPGGVGKTRLALAVAGAVSDAYPEGAWLLELASLSDPAGVTDALAGLLGLREERGRALLSTIVAYLQDRQALLVLDNCEHLIDACAALVAALLRSCPLVRILATSQVALDIAGERRHPVAPLLTPDLVALLPAARLAENPAVALFVARARDRDPDFALTDSTARACAEICARLDGIPLAIELAAARVSVLPVGAIAARLDDRLRLLTGGPRSALPRQQTLRAALDWSHDLLDEPAQIVLRRLSVFAGGCTLAVAETVCAGGAVDKWGVLDLLDQLVSRSLLGLEMRAGEARYRLLETVRQYARERLRVAGEEQDVLDRHLGYAEDLAIEADPMLVGPEQRAWLARLDAEHDNLRAALGWALSGAGDGDAALLAARAGRGLRIASALWRYWYIRGHFREGRDWLERAVADPVAWEDGTSAAKAKALRGAGILAFSQGEYEAARRLCQEGLAVAEALGDRQGIAVALSILGSVAVNTGDYDRAIALSEQSLTLQREGADRRGIAVALNNLGILLLGSPRAEDLFAESLALNRELGDRRGVALALNNLGIVRLFDGDRVRAAALCEESLALMRELDDKTGMAVALETLAEVAFDLGDYARTEGLCREGLELRVQSGDPSGIALLRTILAHVARERADYSQAAALYAESLSFFRDAGDTERIVNCLLGLARTACLLGNAVQALRFCGAALALHSPHGPPLAPAARAAYEVTMASARAELGEGAAAAYAEGEGTPPAQIVAEALAMTVPDGSGAMR